MLYPLQKTTRGIHCVAMDPGGWSGAGNGFSYGEYMKARNTGSGGGRRDREALIAAAAAKAQPATPAAEAGIDLSDAAAAAGSPSLLQSEARGRKLSAPGSADDSACRGFRGFSFSALVAAARPGPLSDSPAIETTATAMCSAEISS